MIKALLYLQCFQARNLLIRRLRQFKRPTYIIGIIIAVLYFYFFLIRNLFLGGEPLYEWSSWGWLSDPRLAEPLGALVLLVIVLFMWLIPRKRAMLAFTETEVAFLFPAPITRRGLIHFKLLLWQFGILLSVLFLMILSCTLSACGDAFYRAIGFWVILSTLNLHSVGASFALTMLMDRGLSTRKQRFAILTLVFAGLAVVGVWVVRTLPPLMANPLADMSAVTDYGRQVLVSGPVPILLYPFRLIIRPFLATDMPGMLHALWPALLLLGAHYCWVIRSNVAFEEASVEASQKLAEAIAVTPAGSRQMTGEKNKGKRPPFTLGPVGGRPTALLWKNLIAAGHGFTARTWITMAVVVVGISFVMWIMTAQLNCLLVGNALVVTLLLWTLILGPQLLRQDFRQDFQQLDILKMYPMHGWQIALGEILAPVVILTCLQWLLLVLLAFLLLLIAGSCLGPELIVMVGFATAILLPALNLISWLIPNAMVLLFPGWFRASKESARGIEATVHQLLYSIGQFLVFIVAMIPAAAFFYVLLKYLKYAMLAVPLAAVAAALLLAVEVALGVLLLGWLFERFDVSAEMT